MISNKEKESWHYFAVKKLSALLREITSKHQDPFIVLQQKATLNLMKEYAKIRFLWNYNAITKG